MKRYRSLAMENGTSDLTELRTAGEALICFADRRGDYYGEKNKPSNQRRIK